MSDHADLIRELMDDYRLSNEKRTAIKELVAERDRHIMEVGKRDMRMRWLEARAEKAEADLAAARKALRKSLEYLGLLHQFMCDAHKCDFNEDRTVSWVAYMAHEVRKFSHDEKTIAAARAQGGE